MMMKNPKLKKQSQNLRGKKLKKSSKKLKVWEELASFSLLKFSIFSPFFSISIPISIPYLKGFGLDPTPLGSRTEGKSKWLLGPSPYTA